MERYAEVLNYAIPFFFALLLIEAIAARRMNKQVIRSMDTLSSLSSGVTNAIKDVLGLTLIIISYDWFVDKVALFHFEATWLVYILAFIGLDFAGYWNHRLSHQVNYFWNTHIIHHSSEEFNLACALRQSISTIFSTLTFFLIPTALLGVPGEVIAVVAPLHLFAQYWYHTRLIGRMGILEKILVTPSHHRVHHAMNKEYMDKNMAQIFIIWDKLFGTFQEELKEVPCVYGVKRPVKTWNPVLINFAHLWLLILDAWRAHSWKDKLLIWFMPTGWRPQDVAEKYPIETINDVFTYQKYDPKVSGVLQIWSWFQFAVAMVMMLHMFQNFAAIGFPGVIIYGAFITLCIFSLTMLMDKNPFTIHFELLKAIIGASIIWFQKDWFKLDSHVSTGSFIILGYLVISVVVVAYFTQKEVRSVASGHH